jgi:glutathione transport system permease protein
MSTSVSASAPSLLEIDSLQITSASDVGPMTVVRDLSRGVVWGHALRNALIPVITLTGLEFGSLLGGAIVIETVFSWPGLGRLLVDSVGYRDYPVIQAEILLFSLEFVLINLVVDLLYAVVNPEIRLR